MELPEQDRQALIDAARRRSQPKEGGAAFGVYPSSGKRPEKLNVSRDVNMPAQLARGWVAGTLGLPGDIESLGRMALNFSFGPGGVNVDETPVLPTSEFYQEYLPGGDERPAAKFASGLGALAGGAGSTKVAGAALKGAKATGKALGPKASEMAESYLKKSGLVHELIAYHGTPHRFAPEEGAPLGKFRSEKIGTGEGAQAYGHGHYAAEARNVAQSYADVLASPRNRVGEGRGVYIEPSPISGGKYMLATRSEIGQPRGLAADATQFIYPEKEFSSIAAAIKFAKRKGLLSKDERPKLTAVNEDRKYVPVTKASDVAEPEYTQFIASDPGYLYTVDIPDEMVSKMLDWDKPLSQQPKTFQDLVSDLPRFQDSYVASKATAGEAYGELAGKLGSRAKASEALRQAGIPGIRYLDRQSRPTNIMDKRLQGIFEKHNGDIEKTANEYMRSIYDTPKEKEKIRASILKQLESPITRNFVIFPGEEESVKIIERKAEGGLVQDTDAIAAKLTGMDKDKALTHALRMANAKQEAHMAVGGLAKLLKGAKAAEEAAAAAKAAKVRTPEELSVIEKFGQKQEQEAVRQKKVEKASKESASQSPEDQAAKSVKSKGPRVKAEPDVYRKMSKAQGDEAVLRAARAGKHLKPTGEGYIGAPRTVTSGQGLGAMRRAMDADFADSVEAVRLADPDRLGTWYDRAKQGIAESTEPYQLPRVLEQHGVYSAGVSPESELAFALKHLNSRVAGDPKMAYRGAGMRNLDTAVSEDRPAKMGFKIGEYAEKNDPRVPNAGLFGVNDFRRAQGMGYTDPQGNPWKAGVSDTMHPFMDAETALQVDRANAAGTGGRTDWRGPHIQEVPWVYGKAQDLYSRGKKGRYGGDELEGIKGALQDANNTARDYMYKHAASATHEQIPGASLGHVRQALDMTPEEKLAYGQVGRFDVPAPEAALNEFPEVGAGRRDSIYGALGYRQLPSRQAEGLYMNKLGEVETNPMTIARPLMDFPTGGGGLMALESRKVMDAAEQFRALMDAQEAGAYNLPNTMGGVKGKNSMVLDTRGRVANKLADPSAGLLPTSEQLAKMNELVGEKGFGVTASNRGAVMFPFDATMDPKQASKAMRQSSKGLEKIFPSSQQKSLSTMGYVPGVGKRSPEGPLSTAPYSGEATADILKAFSELPPTVSQNLGESEAVREAIRAKALRDSKMGGTRGDIQETRRFFSEADWPKAVALIRQGMTPAAALAALGYSINAMAADER